MRAVYAPQHACVKPAPTFWLITPRGSPRRRPYTTILPTRFKRSKGSRSVFPQKQDGPGLNDDGLPSSFTFRVVPQRNPKRVKWSHSTRSSVVHPTGGPKEDTGTTGCGAVSASPLDLQARTTASEDVLLVFSDSCRGGPDPGACGGQTPGSGRVSTRSPSSLPTANNPTHCPNLGERISMKMNIRNGPPTAVRGLFGKLRR